MIDYPYSSGFFILAFILFWFTIYERPFSFGNIDEYERDTGVVDKVEIEPFLNERSDSLYYELAIYFQEGKRFFVRNHEKNKIEKYLPMISSGSQLQIYHLPANLNGNNFRIVHVEDKNGSIIDIQDSLSEQSEITKIILIIGLVFSGLFVIAYIYEYKVKT